MGLIAKPDGYNLFVNHFFIFELTMKIPPLRILASVLFFLGIISGFSIAIISTWSKVESADYFFRGTTYEHFSGLRCPLLLTRSETGVVNIIFDNPTDSADDFYYKVEISGFLSPRQIEGHVSVPAHQKSGVGLTVNKDDIDLQFFVFVKIVISPNGTRPTRGADCGIMVLDNSRFTGGQLFMTALVLSLLGIILGFVLWRRSGVDVNSDIQRVMQLLGIVVLLAMFAGLVGWWFIGILFIVLTLLLFLILVRFGIAKT